jgi:hypothetical protein
VIEPNRLTDPAERAARERVEVVFTAVDAFSPGQLADLVISARDQDERDRLLRIVQGAVAAHGRDELLTTARNAVRDALNARINEANLAGPHGFVTISASRVEDRVAVVAAIEDVVAVAGTKDRGRADGPSTLPGPGWSLLGLDPLARDDDAPSGGRSPAWEPSPDEWRDAELGGGMDPAPPLPGVHRMKVILFGAIALLGASAAIAGGIANDQLLIGALAAIAVVVLCWTFATYRSAA